jgi:hypothetical protein
MVIKNIKRMNDMTLMQFDERIDTSLSDSINVSKDTVNFGLQGNDKFTLSSSTVIGDWVMLVGGQGNDTYGRKAYGKL